MREKGKRLIAIILSCLLLLSNVTVYAATEAEAQSDTQNTVSVNASEEAVTLPEEPTNGSAGEEAVVQNEPNAEDTSDETEETETLAPINETDQGNVYAEEILNDLNVRIRDMNRYGAQKGIRNNALGELDKAMVALRKSLYETQKEMRYNMMVYEQDIRAEIDGYVLEERRGLT